MTNKCKDCLLFTTDCWEVTPGRFTSYGHFGPEKGLMGKCLRDGLNKYNKGLMGKCLRDGEMPDSEKRPFQEQIACEEFQDKRPESPW